MPADNRSPLAARRSPLAAIVDSYHRHGDLGLLLDELKALARETPPDRLKTDVEPYRDLAEVVIPVYESIVERAPADAQSMVVLANAYWLTGRGTEAVSDLATRAIAADRANRGAWHLWALADPSLRGRVERWQQVATEFPTDQLARAALADNATSLAHDEQDPLALDLAIATYEGLLGETTDGAQRDALEGTLKALRGWRV